MESYFTCIIYQNQLFADGLESILQNEDYKIFKKSLTQIHDLLSDQLSKITLLIIEANWPFPLLENLLEQFAILSGSDTKILLITNILNKSIFRLACKCKIQGIVLKGSSTEELLFGIKQVMDGKTYYSSVAANVILKNNLEPRIMKISKKEKQILSLLADMNSTEEIAQKLSITKSTVKTHRRNLMQKFNAKNILGLLRLACRENLLNEEIDFCGCCYKQYLGV